MAKLVQYPSGATGICSDEEAQHVHMSGGRVIGDADAPSPAFTEAQRAAAAVAYSAPSVEMLTGTEPPVLGKGAGVVSSPREIAAREEARNARAEARAETPEQARPRPGDGMPTGEEIYRQRLEKMARMSRITALKNIRKVVRLARDTLSNPTDETVPDARDALRQVSLQLKELIQLDEEALKL